MSSHYDKSSTWTDTTLVGPIYLDVIFQHVHRPWAMDRSATCKVQWWIVTSSQETEWNLKGRYENRKCFCKHVTQQRPQSTRSLLKYNGLSIMTASLVICHKIINIHHTMATSKEERFLKSASIRKYFGSSLQPSLSCPSSTMSNKNTYLKRSSWRQNAQCQSGTLILLYICC